MTDIQARVENWARWVRNRRFPPTLQCESLEGQYRSPQRNHWDFCSRPPSRLPAPDTADAWDVALAVATLARKYVLVLHFCHVEMVAGRPLPDGTVAKEMRKRLGERISESDVAATENMAKVLLAAALLVPVSKRRERSVSYARQLLAA